MATYSSLMYSHVAQKVLLAAKEDSLASADELVLSALMKSLHFFMRERNVAGLVPVPSRKNAQRKRGRDFISSLTADLSAHSGIPSLELLTHARRVKDQSSLSHKSRLINLQGALKVDEVRGNIPGCEGVLLLVDDVVTSGATLLEARRALLQAGFSVSGAVTACTAQPLGLHR